VLALLKGAAADVGSASVHSAGIRRSLALSCWTSASCPPLLQTQLIGGDGATLDRATPDRGASPPTTKRAKVTSLSSTLFSLYPDERVLWDPSRVPANSPLGGGSVAGALALTQAQLAVPIALRPLHRCFVLYRPRERRGIRTDVV